MITKLNRKIDISKQKSDADCDCDCHNDENPLQIIVDSLTAKNNDLQYKL